MQREGAGTHWYTRITFNENGYEWIQEAYKDDMCKKYQIGGEDVSLEKIEEYVKNGRRNLA